MRDLEVEVAYFEARALRRHARVSQLRALGIDAARASRRERSAP